MAAPSVRPRLSPRPRWFVVLGGVFLLAACGSTDPWEDRRREAGLIGTVGTSQPTAPVFCHKIGEDRAVLDRMAAEQCAAHGLAAYYKGTQRYQCRLLTPHRSYYECR